MTTIKGSVGNILRGEDTVRKTKLSERKVSKQVMNRRNTIFRDRVWADKVLEIVNKGGSSEAGSRNLDGEIIELMQSIFSHAHFIVETPAESVLVKLMKERGNPIDIDGSVTDMEADYRRYLEDKEADWKEDLHHSLLLKIADIIDSQLRLEGQCPGASQLGPGTVAAAIRTAVKNHKEA